MTAETYNKITYDIIACAIEVHRVLGPGLLESVYRKATAWELRQMGYRVEEEVPVPVRYKGEAMGIGFRIDILVEGLVVVECKTVDALLPVHAAQTRSNLVLGNKKIALLINFRERLLKDGVRRVANGLEEGDKI